MVGFLKYIEFSRLPSLHTQGLHSELQSFSRHPDCMQIIGKIQCKSVNKHEIVAINTELDSKHESVAVNTELVSKHEAVEIKHDAYEIVPLIPFE